MSIVLRFRKIHSSWCCWLRSPSSEGISSRATTWAAFCADMLRRISSALLSRTFRYVANLGLGPDFILTLISFFVVFVRRHVGRRLGLNGSEGYDADPPSKVAKPLRGELGGCAPPATACARMARICSITGRKRESQSAGRNKGVRRQEAGVRRQESGGRSQKLRRRPDSDFGLLMPVLPANLHKLTISLSVPRQSAREPPGTGRPRCRSRRSRKSGRSDPY